MTQKIYFATGNPWKIHEVERAIQPFGLEVEPLNIDFAEPDTDVETIAISKVMQAYAIYRKPVIVCDSGFFVDGHPNGSGYPGPLAKRLGYVANPQKMLDEMKNVADRQCHFQTCLAYYDGYIGNMTTFQATVYGTMCRELREVRNPGCCGCYRLFLPIKSELAWSEMTEAQLLENKTDIMRAAAAFASWYTKK